MRFIKSVIVIALVLVNLAALAWLLNKEFLFSGQWTGGFDFSSDSKLVKPLTPSVKDHQGGDVFAVFEKLPARFFINKSGLFKTLGMEAWFKTNMPVVRASVVAQKDPWQIKTKTLYNKYLEDLSWFKTEQKNAAGDIGLTLWQKQKNFTTPDDFLKENSAPDKVLTLNYDWQTDLTLPGYKPRLTTASYNFSLRGPQTIYLYLGDEDFNWRFYFQDVNRHDGQDDIDIRVMDVQGSVVLEENMADDGEVWGSGRMSPLRELTLKKSLPAGVYKMQISAPDDVFVRRFQTSQQKFVFQYVVYLGDVSANLPAGYPVYLFGKTKNLTFRTPHETGEQTVSVDDKRLEVKQIDENYKLKTAGEFTRVTVARPDLKIDFDGFFALSAEAFFLPRPLGFDQASDLTQFKTDYVLAADYEPSIMGDWLLGQTRFTLDNVDQKDGLEIFFDALGSEEPVKLALTQMRVNLGRDPMTIKTFLAKVFVKIRLYFKN